MKKILLWLSILINLFYLTNFLFDFGLKLPGFINVILGGVFVASLISALFLLIRSKKHEGLAVTVLSLSLASLGWFVFINYLSLIMGG
ncbi:hypothetical protein EQV77_06355 [Halobacillus fulvus]|nr:hypothetical protein EQV77_06355 [Halobacillus fulvus]